MGVGKDWKRCDSKVFWRDIAADDHVVQIYDDDQMLLNSLEAFAADGFDQDDSVVVIATPTHLNQLMKRLNDRGYGVNEFIARDQYIPLDAEDTLAKFMVNREPNEKYFMETVSAVMNRARKNNRKVRAFGEMVVLLWQKGNSSATIQLEHLWNKFSEIETFSLFCAYPESDFKDDAGASVMHICTAHSKLIRSDQHTSSAIEYVNVV